MLSILCTALLAAFPAPAGEPIPVLLVTGQNNHDWEYTSRSLKEMLEASGKFTVDVTTTPGETLADADGIARYAAFVLDYNGDRWGEAAEANFVEAVRGGTGVSVIHAANNAFDGWREYEEIVALCWRAGTGHGSFHAFEVGVTDRDHPITSALPDMRRHPDELYHRLAHMHETDYRVLATAFSDERTGGTGVREPMILVKQYGEGRVFHTPLGHVWRNVPDSMRSHSDPQFQNLVVRGTEWAATGRVTDGLAEPNALSPADEAAGWRLLFDGQSLDGWRSLRGDAEITGWEVVDGCLVRKPGEGAGGDIVADGRFANFELAFEWKVAPGANSGVKYRVQSPEGAGSMLGPEYQVLGDRRSPEGMLPLQSAAALYAVAAPEGKELALTGAFNHSRIVCRGDRIEHWLNGVRVVALEVGSEDWNERLAASKFKNVEGFATERAGLVGLQDHGGEVWYRSIRVRDWDAIPGTPVELYDGETLDGWRMIGDAGYETLPDGIRGTSTSGRHTFLVTEREFGDFVLEVDVRARDRGNSGIQVRSEVLERPAVRGYQIEIDNSERAWSGGLYEEGARGWLDDLADNPAGRAAYRFDDWNRYRIECVGNRVRAWVNGVPTADYTDTEARRGVIGLQVHGGNNTDVTWRNPRLWDLSARD